MAEKGRSRTPGDIFVVVCTKRLPPVSLDVPPRVRTGRAGGAILVVVIIAIRDLSEVQLESDVGPNYPIAFGLIPSV